MTADGQALVPPTARGAAPGSLAWRELHGCSLPGRLRFQGKGTRERAQSRPPASCEFLRPSISAAGPTGFLAGGEVSAPPASGLARRRGSRPPNIRPPARPAPRLSRTPASFRGRDPQPAPSPTPLAHPAQIPPWNPPHPDPRVGPGLRPTAPSRSLRSGPSPVRGSPLHAARRSWGCPSRSPPPSAGPAEPYFGTWRSGPGRGSPARKGGYSGPGRLSSCDPRASRQGACPGQRARWGRAPLPPRHPTFFPDRAQFPPLFGQALVLP